MMLLSLIITVLAAGCPVLMCIRVLSQSGYCLPGCGPDDAAVTGLETKADTKGQIYVSLVA